MRRFAGVAVLTFVEAQRLDAVTPAAASAAYDAAYDAAWAAAKYACDPAASAVRYAAAAATVFGVDSWTAPEGAAAALAARHLIDRHGFAQADYDLLTGPWRAVLGKLHQDDADIAA